MVDLDKSLSDENRHRREFYSSLTKILKNTEKRKNLEVNTILQTLNLPITNLQHFREVNILVKKNETVRNSLVINLLFFMIIYEF